ncbi:MAG TPA: zinc-dependent metalloprotease [Polyangia bacterium]|jgi:hypothetical protein|nr:zinc-dependent metalloprotease [Polyangia bacterium]
MNRSISRISMTVVAAAVAQALAGCAGQGDIDRSQPDKIPKAMFFQADGKTPKVFYYRSTYVDVPVTSGWSFEGMMNDVDKVRFDIQKDNLVGYRSYDYAPGASNPLNGGSNNQDAPLVAFKITSHFDVKREYNPGTGEQTNVISENTTDRDWSEREYMRVDFTQNLAEAAVDTSSTSGFFLPTTKTPINSYVSQDDTANPDRPIISPSYFDATIREIRTPDYNACLTMFHPGMDDGAWWDCGPAELKVRHSFMEVPASNYVPLSYPDREPLLDSSGQPIRLANGAFPCSKQAIAQSGGTDCVSASVDDFAKFGFFRTVRQSYDPMYGVTEKGRQYYANRWNIWKDAAAANRASAPDRTTREIVYYTNPEFPDDPELWDMAKTIVGSWNSAMKKTVAALQQTQPVQDRIVPLSAVETAAESMPDIVVLKQNSCNLQNVKDFVTAHGDLAQVVVDATGDRVDALDKTHLLQACTALDQATETLAMDNPKRFTWQRNGDLRYSFLHWVDRPQLQGPLGYGPSSADPETGEIISAGAYIYGAALNTYAQTAVDNVRLLNHSISIDDILSGKTIADVVAENSAKRKATQALPLTDEAKAMATAMLDRGSASSNPKDRLVQIPPGATTAKLAALKGTEVENQMMTTDILNMFGNYYPELAGDEPDLYAKIREMARPENLVGKKARDARANRFRTLATHGCVYMGDFADDSIIGTALEMAGLPPEEIYKRLRLAIFRGVAEHEVGHTMGLRHNFSGSTDALNYGDEYWRIRTTQPENDWHNQKISEYQYSTVMDYGAKFNSDVHGLGKYDEAAIRFGYGQLVDTMPLTANDYGIALSDDIFFNDYKQIPQMVGGTELMDKTATGVVRYQAFKDATRDSFLSPTYRGGVPVLPERPYKFCSDEFVGSLDCKPWDEGASQTEIVDNTIDHFKNYYFFDAFRRDRLRWSINGYYSRLSDRYFSRYTEAFQFFYFFGNALSGSFLKDDLMRASVDSLNSLGEILQTPEPGQHCATAVSPDVLVLPSRTGPNACQNGTGMQVDIGEGKPYFIAFSPDYYYRITRAGSLYEKLAALEALTSTESRFFRVDTFADANQYSINYYRMFKDQMLNLLSGVIRNDPTSYGGYVSGGLFSPTPVVDLTTYGKVKFDPPPYMQPGTRRVDTPVNKTIRYWALGLAFANLDSSWDYTLDISNYLIVTLKGALDDVTFAPGVTVVEWAHPQSGLVYRAPHLDPARLGIGEKLIQELNQITGTWGVPGTMPTKFGYDYDADAPSPDWQTARANLEAAAAGTDQAAFEHATSVFQNVDLALSYRVDLLNDLRRFRMAFAL